MAYRLLTAGSVEIDMMEKQISKKKLERITIHGGDYRRAGQRTGCDLTLERLRQLLEDDVKNLGACKARTLTLTLSQILTLTLIKNLGVLAHCSTHLNPPSPLPPPQRA